MKTPHWLTLLCLAVSLPIQAQTFRPIELKDQELANLRGRYVMPGRIVSFGIVMTSTWQNANGEVIGATSSMQIQQSTLQPQFYVTLIDEKGTGTATSQGTGTITGGGGLNATTGVTQVVRAAGDNNSAWNTVDIKVSKSGHGGSSAPQGQALTPGSTMLGANEAGSMSVSATGTGLQMNIVAGNHQGSSVQRLAQGGLVQNTTLLGNGNQVNNITSLNVVLRDSIPSGGALTHNLEGLKGLRTLGY